MSSDIKISILTVCFNSESTIEDTIKSVENQNYKNLEYIIVDGASKDGTLNVINLSPVVTHFISEPDNGIYDAMNKGLALATGEVIGLINADDFYLDETILSQVAAVFKDPSVDACYADLLYVDQQEINKIIRYWKSCKYHNGMFEKGWMPAHPTFFVRRRVYEKYGNFDLSFPRQADFDLTMRFLEVHQIKSVYVPKVWVKMRIGGVSNNSFSGVLKGNLEAYRSCKKNGLKVGNPFVFIARKIMSRIPQYFSKPST